VLKISMNRSKARNSACVGYQNGSSVGL